MVPEGWRVSTTGDTKHRPWLPLRPSRHVGHLHSDFPDSFRSVFLIHLPYIRFWCVRVHVHVPKSWAVFFTRSSHRSLPSLYPSPRTVWFCYDDDGFHAFPFRLSCTAGSICIMFNVDTVLPLPRCPISILRSGPITINHSFFFPHSLAHCDPNGLPGSPRGWDARATLSRFCVCRSWRPRARNRPKEGHNCFSFLFFFLFCFILFVGCKWKTRTQKGRWAGGWGRFVAHTREQSESKRKRITIASRFILNE